MADPIFFFIMVAGFEYSDKDLGFPQMCTERSAQLLSQIRHEAGKKDPLVALPARLRFLRFDFGAGDVSSIDYALAAKGNKEIALTKDSWRPVPANDPNNSFVTKGWKPIAPKSAFYANHSHEPRFLQELPIAKPIMSIVDVYDAIRNMPRGSLVELSIMSHGADAGPILVNSFETSGSTQLRQESDKDGRSDKDFQANMGRAGKDGDLERFVGAFSKNSSFRLWGCNATRVPKEVIYQTYQARVRPGSKDPLKGKLLNSTPNNLLIADDQKFDFLFENKKPGKPDEDDEFNFVDNHILDDNNSDEHFLTLDQHKDPSLHVQKDGSGNITRVTCTRTFAQIRGLVASYLENSYALNAAEKCGPVGGTFDCYGALPGTSAEPERKGYELLHVDEHTYGARLDFYRRILGVEIDKAAGRGYGRMTADLAAKVREWAKVIAF